MIPNLGKGTECIKLLVSQISPYMREAIVPMLFPGLGAYVTGTEFLYVSNKWYEPSKPNTDIADIILGEARQKA